MTASSAPRVIAYIDGFNLYFGLREARFSRYFWLNIHGLAQNLLLPGQSLVEAKYFTARLSGPSHATPAHLRPHISAKQMRQTSYLDALSTRAGLQVIEGHFLPKSLSCRKCGNSWQSPEEKMTDVNIATEMLVDGFKDRFDTALLISGDSDLVPPIKALRETFPKKRVVVCFPPRRHSKELRKMAHAAVSIGRRALAKSLLPPQITLPDGTVLNRPASWQ